MAAKFLSDDELFASPGGGGKPTFLSDEQMFATDEQFFGTAPEQPTDPRPRGYMPTPETDETTKRFDRREARLNPQEPQPIGPRLSDIGSRVGRGFVGGAADTSRFAGAAAQQFADSVPQGDREAANFYSNMARELEKAINDGTVPADRIEQARKTLADTQERARQAEERVARLEAGGSFGAEVGGEAEKTPAYKFGDSLDQWAKETFPTDPSMDDDFVSKLASGAGSMGYFVTGSILGGIAGAPAWFTAGVLGATSAGGSGFRDARQAKAAADVAYKSMWLNSALGATEAVPINRALDRLDKATGGGVQRIIREGFKGGLEELIQEVIQSIGGKAIAGDYVGLGYRPEADDPTWENTLGTAEDGSVGFILGAALSTLTSAIGSIRGRRGGDGTDTTDPTDNQVPPLSQEEQDAATRAAIDALDPAQQPPTNIAPPKRMAPVTPEDEASDLPTPLISRGKAVIDDILSGRETDFGDSAPPAPADLEPVYDFDDDGNRIESRQIGWTNPQTREFLSLEEGNRVRQSPPADSATQGRGLLAGQVGEGMSIPELSGERTSITPSLSPDLPPVTPTASPDRPPVAPTSPAQPSGDVELVDPDTIQTDPQTFQFKSGGDAQGVTDTLKGTPSWNSDYAGVAIVWERADGQRFIVDGHQRLGLAKRAKEAGQNGVQMRVRVFREADGVTAQEATFKGALKNIAEGGESTKPIDVARLLRNAANREDAIAEAQKFIPPRRRAFQDGVALSGLGDQAWGMVINETVPANFAAVVGQRIEDPAQQVAALGYIAKNPPGNIDQARMVVDQIKAAGFSEGTQESLFGSETLTESLISERAKVLDSAIRNLKAMKKVFKTAVDGGDILAAAGNVLDADANQQQLSENERLAMVLEKLAQRRGPVSDALSEAARALKAGESVAKARDRFLEAVRAVENFDDGASAPVLTGSSGNAGASTDAVSDQEVDPDAPERDPNTDDMFGAPPVAEPEAPREPRTERTDQGENYVLGDDIAPEVQPGDRERERERQRAEDAAKEAGVRQNQSKIRRGDQEGVEGLGMFDTQSDMLDNAAQDDEANRPDPNPTDAQKEAGNYKKKHITWNGFDISIEVEAGGERTSKAGDENQWSVTMPVDYGYIRRTEGADGEQVDVYVGPDGEDTNVFVFDQYDPDTGEFDEHKVMVGFGRASAAIRAYMGSFSDGRGAERAKGLTSMTVAEFRDWLDEGDMTKPLAPEREAAEEAAKERQETNRRRVRGKINRVIAALDGRKEIRLTTNTRVTRITDPAMLRASDTGTGAQMAEGTRNGQPRWVNLFEEQVDQLLSQVETRQRPQNSSGRRTASWVIKDKQTGEVVMETFDGNRVDEIDTTRYEAVPIEDHLASLNQPQDTNDSLTPNSGENVSEGPVVEAVSAETFRNWKNSVESEGRVKGWTIFNDTVRNRVVLMNDEAMASGFTSKADAINWANKNPAKNVTPPRPDATSRQPKRVALYSEQVKIDPDSPPMIAEFLTEMNVTRRWYTGLTDAEHVALEDAYGDNKYYMFPQAIGNVNSAEDQRKIRERWQAHLAPGAGVATPTPSSYGDSNKLVSTDRAELAKQRLREKLRNQLNASAGGIDPEIMAEGAILAVYHVEAGARKFSDFAKAVIDDLGDAAKPFLKMWYNAARDYPGMMSEGMTPYNEVSAADVDALIGGDTDVSGGNARVEPDRSNDRTPDGLGEADVSASAGVDAQGAGSGARPAGEADGQSGGNGRADGRPAVVGTQGDSDLFGGLPFNDGRASDTREPERGADNGVDGSAPDPIPAGAVKKTSSDSADVEARRRAQRAAENIPVKPGRENVRETLPMLLEGQQDDVVFAETRFAKPNGHGVLFTNGTGTGKTFTGLGVVKRFARQGKDNILIVAPSQGILDAWVTSARDLGLDIKILESKQDNGGSGIVATTYHNLGDNPTLADRSWDLVVTDESHKITENQKGTTTLALDMLRAITNRPRDLRARAELELRDQKATLQAKRDELKIARSSDDQRQWDRINKLEAELRPLEADFRKAVDEKIAQRAAEPRSKVVMLSATPFATDKNVDYAEGYLFDYPPAAGQGYNQPDGQQAFMIQHFGYRMRYNRLTTPEASVNSEVLERAFHQWLRREGVLSGRRLEVEADYDRKFVLVNDAIGNQIDKALDALANDQDGKFRPLYDTIRKRFDYLTRLRLLEALKATHAVEYIRQQHALGRKVVVFHNYIEGGGTNPFANTFEGQKVPVVGPDGVGRIVDLGGLFNEFLAAHPYVKNLNFADMKSPIETLTKEFPNALLYNGDVSKKQRNANRDKFNTDGGPHNLIIVQSDAGQAGISLHDTTGEHQRVLINLGMPTRPVAAIQQEGRIYRTGQVSNAIFRYFNTGTTWERQMFASTIAQRAATAENLALGEEARALKQAFIDAYLDSDDYPPSADEGTGGKESDRADRGGLTAFEKAKTFYWGQQKKTSRNKAAEGKDYFATPEPIGLKMVEFAGLKFGERVLEPSAGHGAIARFFPEGNNRTIIEPSAELSSRAAMAAPGVKVIDGRFEDHNVVNKYDAIVMNPPFGVGGKTAIEHLEKAATKHLRNGGRIVVILPTGPAADKRFEDFMLSEANRDNYLIADIKLPAATFERAGTKVMTRIVVLERQTDRESAEQVQPTMQRDYSSVETINDLFDRIEHLDMPARIEPQTKEALQLDVPETGEITAGGVTFKLSQQTFTMRDGTTATTLVAKPAKRLGKDEFRRVAKLVEKNFGAYEGGEFVFNGEDAAENRAAFLSALENAPEAEADTEAAAGNPRVASGGLNFEIIRQGESRLIAKLVGKKVDRDEFQDINRVAKRHNGDYGRMVGWVFPTEADRKAFLDAWNGVGGPVEVPAQPFDGEAAPATEAPAGITADSFKLAQTKHSKTGEDLWVASLQERVDRAIYDTLNKIASEFGGWYSTYRVRGGIPGFQFKSEGARQQFLDRASGQRRGRLQAPATSAFKRWFGDSKVVDANGDPLVVYHGTNADIEAFDAGRGARTTGAEDARHGFFFSSNPDVAASYTEYYDPYIDVLGDNWFSRTYARMNEALMRMIGGPSAYTAGGNVMPIYLSIQNPFVIETRGQEYEPQTFMDAIRAAKDAGHDGVVFRGARDSFDGEGSASDVYVPFRPEQIKSASGNNGDFNPADPRIRYRAPGQGIDFDAYGTRPTRTADGERAARAVIALLQKIAPRSRVQAFDSIVDADGNILGDGHYLDGVISIALTGNNVLGTARHEAIHFLKEIGAIRPDQWLALRSAAIREDWIKRHNIRERYRKERLTEEQLLEEAIAEEYTKWATGTTERPGAVQRAFAAMRRLFDQIKATIREALGREPSAADVFSWIESGRIGRQDRVRPTTGSALADALLAGKGKFAFDAWHGSPHQFDQFSTDFMGSGEGAQAFGWGLYFASRREVAEHYQRTLSRGPGDVYVRGEKLDDQYSFLATQARNIIAEKSAGFSFEQSKARSVEDMEARSRSERRRGNNDLAEEAQQAADTISGLAEGDITEQRGALYEVNINAEIDHMLDWDKPLSEQSEYVRERLRNMFGNDSELLKAVQENQYAKQLNGHGIYVALSRMNGVPPPSGSLMAQVEPESRVPNDRAASLALLEVGIPGIKYLDGSSRRTGEGAHNYVIFDGNAVETRGRFQRNLGQQYRGPANANQPTAQRRGQQPQQNSLGIMNIALPDKGVFDNLFNGNRSFTQNLRASVSRSAIRASGNELREYLQDSFIRLRRVQEAITEITGQPLSEAEDAYRAEEMFAGRVGARLDEVQSEHKEPLARAIADTLGGKTMTIPDGDGGQMEATGYEILEAYLYARHAPERNMQIAGINPDFPDGGSGMTDADAETIMSTLRRDGLMADVQSLADMVDTMLRDSLEKRVQYGLMSQQDALKWRQTYNNYVPLRGIQELGDDGDADPARPRSGQGYNVRGPESRRALGRRSRATDILANVFTIADEAVIRGEKNTVFKAFHNLVSNHPDPDLWEINPVRMAYGINKQTGQVELRPVSALTAAQAAHTVRGKINGQEVRIQIHDTHLAEAMNKVGANFLDNMVVRTMAAGTRWLSAVNTSLNPEFLITNAFRDVQAAGVLLQQHNIAGITKATILNWRRGLTAVMDGQGIERTAGVAGAALDRAERARWKQVYEEFNRAGGRVNFWKIEDINDHKKAFAEAMRDASPSAGRKMFLAARGIGRYIENLNTAFDNAVRLSAYKAARDAGWSEQQAASLAKNLTVNFNRKGKLGPTLNAAYMFFNAAVQGSTILLSGIRRSKRVRRAVAGLMVAGFLAEMLNVMLSDEDDETGELAYDKIGGSRESADFLKSRNIVLVDPFGLTDDKYVTIPLPYGFNLFWDAGRNMAAYMRGGQTAGRTLGNIARTGIDAFNPLGSGSLLNVVFPTFFDPIVDLYNNENFMGGRIYPAPFEFDQSPPPLSAQPWSSTSWFSKETAELLNELTGGDQISPGAIDLPPQALDHIGGFVTGGAGRFYAGILDTTIKSLSSFAKGETPDIELREIPFARKIVRSQSDYRDRRDAYEAIGEIQEVAGRYRDYVKAGRPADAKDPSTGREPLIGLYKQAGKVKKALSDIRKERIRLEGLGYRPDSPEIERINAIEDRTIKLLMVRYRAAKKQMGESDGTAEYIDTARRAIGTGGER